MTADFPTSLEIAEENVRQRLQREAERGIRPMPEKFCRVRVSVREEK